MESLNSEEKIALAALCARLILHLSRRSIAKGAILASKNSFSAASSANCALNAKTPQNTRAPWASRAAP